MIGVLFSKILEMTIWGSYSILVVLIARLLLRGCDRKYAYWLWLAAFLNLVIPFHVEGTFSLFPAQMAQTADSARAGGIYVNAPEETDTGAIYVLERASAGAENMAPVSYEEAFPVNEEARRLSVMDIAGIVWCAGVVCLLFCNAAAVWKLQRKLRQAKVGRGDIRETDGIKTPFLWGVLRPAIYIPKGTGEPERTYIIAHELCHKKRKDYIIKPLLYLAAILHWFNPLVYLAYRLCVRDMEISCDERVIADAARNGEDIKKQYAESLFQYALKQNGYIMTPLTFGEPSVKERIQNVLRYHKKSAAATALALLGVVLITVGLTVKPKAHSQAALAEEALHTVPAGQAAQTAQSNEDDTASLETESIENDAASFVTEGIEDKMLSFVTEGVAEEIRAETYERGDFYILIPTEGWRRTGPDLWTSAENDRVRLWIADMGLGTLDEAKEALIAQGYQKTPEAMLYFQKTENDERECVRLVAGEETVWSVRYRHPDTAEYEEGFGSLLRAIAATFSTQIFRCPCEYIRISNDFGGRAASAAQESGKHEGIDFAADEGTSVWAAADGVVEAAGYTAQDGNYIILRHENGLRTHYAHCKEVLAQKGDRVKEGQTIATVGSSGMSTGAHLHFALSYDNEYMDPWGYLMPQTDNIEMIIDA